MQGLGLSCGTGVWAVYGLSPKCVGQARWFLSPGTLTRARLRIRSIVVDDRLTCRHSIGALLCSLGLQIGTGWRKSHGHALLPLGVSLLTSAIVIFTGSIRPLIQSILFDSAR